MLAQIVAAGLRGSDHGNLRPWRVIHVTDRGKLADMFIAAERELRPDGDAEMIERATSRAKNGPCVLVLVARIDEHSGSPQPEQWFAIGSALNQMLLAAASLGFAGGILSGAKTTTNALRDGFGIAAEEQIVGFLTFGTAGGEPKPISPLDPQEYLATWP